MLTMQSGWPISVSSSSLTSPEDEVFVFGAVICVFQVSGESAAWPAQAAGGAAEVSAAAAPSGRLWLCRRTVTGISWENTENMTI